MTRFPGTYQLAAIRKAGARLPPLWIGVLRIFSCVVFVLVLSLFAAPNSAQAHGLHGSQVFTAPIALTDAATQAVELGSLGKLSVQMRHVLRVIVLRVSIDP